MLNRLLFIILFISTLLFSKEGYGQCVEADVGIPNCIEVGNQVTFLNNSIDYNTCTNWQETNYTWEIYDDATGGAIYYESTITTGFNTNWSPPAFPTTGSYTITLSPQIPGNNNNCCPFSPGNNGTPSMAPITFYVTSTPLLSIQTITSIYICDGNSIDTSDINLQITNAVGNLSFEWITATLS